MTDQHAQPKQTLSLHCPAKHAPVDQPHVATVEMTNGDKPVQQSIMSTYRSYDAVFSKKTEKRLVKSIDIRLLPLIVTIYVFNYLDRNSITQARLYGLQEDTHVTGATYNTAISIFSAGYIAMQLPSTLLMAKVQPHIFLVCPIPFAGFEVRT